MTRTGPNASRRGRRCRFRARPRDRTSVSNRQSQEKGQSCSTQLSSTDSSSAHPTSPTWLWPWRRCAALVIPSAASAASSGGAVVFSRVVTKTVTEAVKDAQGNPVKEVVKDAEGNPVKDKDGKEETKDETTENDRRRRPLRGQGRPPQPAHRRPDRHRTVVLAGQPGDRLLARRRRLLGARRRLRPAAADQRPGARLGAERRAERQVRRSSSAARQQGAPADLYTVSLNGGAAKGADQQRRRRPRSLVLGRRQGDRLRPQRRRDGRRHGRRPLLGASLRGRPDAADQDRPRRRVRPALLRGRHRLQPRRERRRRRAPTPTSTRCAATAGRRRRWSPAPARPTSKTSRPDGHLLLFRRDQGLWVKRIGRGEARKLSQLPDGSRDQRGLLLRRRAGRRLRRGGRTGRSSRRSTSPTAPSSELAEGVVPSESDADERHGHARSARSSPGSRAASAVGGRAPSSRRRGPPPGAAV